MEILKIYKYQPYLEKRHEQLKSVYNVAPVFLRNPQRIESLLLLYFLGMLIMSLIERKVRSEMKERDLSSIPIYPEGRPCKSPTADKLIGLFSDVRLQYICKDREIVQIVPDEFSGHRLSLSGTQDGSLCHLAAHIPGRHGICGFTGLLGNLDFRRADDDPR